MGSTLAGLLRVWLRVVDWLPAPSVRMLLLAVLALTLAPAAHADGSYPAKAVSQCTSNCFEYRASVGFPWTYNAAEACQAWTTYWVRPYYGVEGSGALVACKSAFSTGGSYIFYLESRAASQYVVYSCDYGVQTPGSLSGASCLCPAGWVPNGQQNACTAITTPPSTVVKLTLEGPQIARARGAEGAVEMVASVTRDGAVLSGKAVGIDHSGARVGIVAPAFVTTDSQGLARFIYTPPKVLVGRPAVEKFTVRCDGCSNEAKHEIEVLGLIVDTNMCTVKESASQAGQNTSKPILPASGTKLLVEPDWQDSGPHTLTLVRYYASIRNAAAVARMGESWSHGHAHRLLGLGVPKPVTRTVVFGDGNVSRFVNIAAQDQPPRWQADGSLDTLTDTAQGIVLRRAQDDSDWVFDASSGVVLRSQQRNGWVYRYVYSNSLLTQVFDNFGRSLQLAYDSQDRLIRVDTPDGQSINYQYDADSRLVRVIYPGGASRSYLYEDPRWTQFVTGIVNDEQSSRFSTYVYDSQGRAVRSELASGVERYSVVYGGDNATVTDPLGTARGYLYLPLSGSASGWRTTAASLPAPDGDSTSSQSFSNDGLLLAQTDFLGISTLFTWDTSRRLKTFETRAAGRPEAQTTSTQWHPVFRLPTLITEPGRSTAYTYDGQGNQLSQTITDTTTGQSRTWQWSYTPQGLVQTTTDPKGAVWIYGYDSQGNRISTKNPLGQTTAYAYDAAGRLTQQTDPNGLVTSYVWDARGRVTQISRGGEVSSFSYTPTGQLASATQPDGYQTAYLYDAAQRLVGASDSLGNSTSYTLDAMGNRVREEVRDAGGNIALATTRVINTLNQLAAVQNAQLQTTQLAYDANGQNVSSTDPLQHTTRQSLDALGRPTATTFADNASASQSWNQLNQLTGVTDPKGVATGYQRNAFGEVIAETSPDIGRLSYQRDAAGDVIAQTDARGNTTTIERDALGRPTRIQWASDLAAHYTWDTDQAGHLARVEDASGSTTWQRDAQGRILAKTQQVNDNPASPSQFQLRYGYSGGELASLTYPSGLQVRYQRSQGRITGIELQAPGQAAAPFVSNLTYTALGQPKAWSWSSGDSASRSFDANARMSGNELASYSYDAAGRLTGLSQQLWVNRTLADGTLAPYQTTIGWTAQYDSRDRLVGLQREGSSTQYTYDANGNRLSSQEVASGTIDLDDRIQRQGYTYTDARQLRIDASSNRLLGQSLTLSASQGNKTLGPSTAENTYTLDAAGNLTQTGLRRYVYDAANRLESVQLYKDSEGAAIHYLHNAQGQRVFKSEVQAQQTAPNEQELGPGFINWLRKSFGWLFTRGKNPNTSLGQAYVYGDGPLPAWALLGEYDNGTAQGKGRTEYIWLPTHDGAIPIGIYRNGQLYSVHSDHLGTPRLVTDSNKTPVWQWPYSSFGQNKPTGVLSETVNSTTNQATIKPTRPAQELNLRLPGQYWDEESELAYNYWRSYLAEVGRYAQGDPIGIDGGLNRFAYVGGSPLSYSDPEGLLAQGIVDFGVGMGDVMLLGQGQRLRDLLDVDGGVDQCSGEYSAGEWAGIAGSFATGVMGGVKAAGVKAAGMEFSHAIPARVFRPSSKSYSATLDAAFGWAEKTILNGNHVTPLRHYLHDPFRYPKGWRDFGEKLPSWLQPLDRIPNVFKGGAAGAAYGAAGSAMNGCTCKNRT